jgi:hypothetical protein
MPTAALAQASTASLLTFFKVGKEEENANLESFDENDTREDKLLTSPGSLWYLLTIFAFVIDYFSGCESK